MEDKVKVFAMNDRDWMAGESLESVTELYLKEYAGGLPKDEALEDPCEVTEHQMARFRFHDDDAEFADDYQTFQQRLNFMVRRGDKFPCFFASTEY